MERYRLEISLNIWAEDDLEAIKIVNKICEKQKQKYDNRCQVIKLVESTFGSLHEREIV